MLIFREENLDKILLSNQSLDPAEIFARKGCFILSDGKLSPTIFVMAYEHSFLAIFVTLSCFLRFLQFLHSVFLNGYSLSWRFCKQFQPQQE
jgi:hypothetical protein